MQEISFFPQKIQMYPIYSKSNWKIKLIYLAIWMQRGFFFIFKVQNDRLSHKKNYQINEDLIHWLKILEQKMLVFKKKNERVPISLAFQFYWYNKLIMSLSAKTCSNKRIFTQSWIIVTFLLLFLYKPSLLRRIPHFSKKKSCNEIAATVFMKYKVKLTVNQIQIH